MRKAQIVKRLKQQEISIANNLFLKPLNIERQIRNQSFKQIGIKFIISYYCKKIES